MSVPVRLRQALRWALRPSVRWQQRAQRDAFERFAQARGAALGARLGRSAGRRPVALMVSLGLYRSMPVELALVKGLQLAGFSVAALVPPDPWTARYYRLCGVETIRRWDEVLPRSDGRAARAALGGIGSFEALLALESGGVRVGRLTASTTLRTLRTGSLDLASPTIRRALRIHLARSLGAVAGARRLLRDVAPALALFMDRGYTPQGELFERCLANGVDVLTWNAAHKSHALLFKRYTPRTRDEHPASLSDETWRLLRAMSWTERDRQHLQEELAGCYASGDWYSEVGTQFLARPQPPQVLRSRLGLAPGRKAVGIFPHIIWDGTFFWGEGLFANYEEWLVETVRAACRNDRVTWLIKLHPANLIKNARDGVAGDPAELVAIREAVGRLPEHVRVVPADSDISTFSLLRVLDACLTVRGTVGIEAACLGVPVLTAGTGRYDHKGFTIDSATREEYLVRLERIEALPRLSAQQRELAQRFAYGVFVLRPLPLQTMTLAYERDATATHRAQLLASSEEAWGRAADLRAFADWVAGSAEDFLMQAPEASEMVDA